MANKTISRNGVILWMFMLGACLYGVESSLKTTFLEDICHEGGGVIKLQFETTGILMSAPEIHPTSLNCEVILLPKTGHSVVLSIYRYNIEAGSELTIEDSERFKIALKGRGNFKDEKKSIISDGRMAIRYQRESVAVSTPYPFHGQPMNGSVSSPKAGFQFTFTSVRNAPCINDEFACKNGKCILKEYVCDQHNHCGDNSDQKECVPKNTHQPVNYAPSSSGAIWIAAIAVGGVILFTIPTVFIIVFIRQSKRRKVENNTPNADPNCGGGVPLQSVSSTVNEHPPPQPDGGLNANNRSCNCDGVSFYDRVRRSLRRPKDTKRGESAVQTERTESYQVPSMYPNLHLSPSAPEMHGFDNSEYKMEE